MHPPAQTPQRVVVIEFPIPVLVPSMPTTSATEKPAGLSTNANQPALSQPNPSPSSSSSFTLTTAPAQEKQPGEKKQPAPKAASKKNGTVSSAANPRSQSLLDTLPADKKD